MTTKARLVVACMFLLLSTAQCIASAATAKVVACKEQWEYLRGFHAVVVGVDAPDPEFTKSGASKDEIKERVEGMLKSAGVEIAKYDPNDNGTKGIGYLVIRVTTGVTKVKNEDVYGFNIAVNFEGWVFFGAQPDHAAMIPTWTNQMTVVCTKSNVSQVSKTAMNLADFFARDFLQANPKEPAKTQ